MCIENAKCKESRSLNGSCSSEDIFSGLISRGDIQDDDDLESQKNFNHSVSRSATLQTRNARLTLILCHLFGALEYMK
jgi:hypothetical protein